MSNPPNNANGQPNNQGSQQDSFLTPRFYHYFQQSNAHRQTGRPIQPPDESLIRDMFGYANQLFGGSPMAGGMAPMQLVGQQAAPNNAPVAHPAPIQHIVPAQDQAMPDSPNPTVALKRGMLLDSANQDLQGSPAKQAKKGQN